MGLFHTMQNKTVCKDINDYCSDTPLYTEIINQGLPDPCPTWNHNNPYMSNNLMDYSGYQVVTPEQLGRIHYTLMHDMLPYLYDDYCVINNNEPVCVLETGQNLTWQNDRILKNNLIIENGAKLTLKDCILHVPAGANIIVKQGGRTSAPTGRPPTCRRGLPRAGRRLLQRPGSGRLAAPALRDARRQPRRT